MQETLVQFLGQEDPLEKGKATHSSILAWRIPWTVYPWGRKELTFTGRENNRTEGKQSWRRRVGREEGAQTDTRELRPPGGAAWQQVLPW